MKNQDMYGPYPTVIQGGVGVGVSNWRLAQAVARFGQLGVLSGTAPDQVFARRLGCGSTAWSQSVSWPATL